MTLTIALLFIRARMGGFSGKVAETAGAIIISA
jgi:hypothetical protein